MNCTDLTFVQLILAIVFTIPGDIGKLIDFVGFLQWIFYGMNFLAVIIFRYKRGYKDLPRPVKVCSNFFNVKHVFESSLWSNKMVLQFCVFKIKLPTTKIFCFQIYHTAGNVSASGAS